MKKNMGNADKALRILIAIAIALLYYFDIISGAIAYILMVVSIVLLITSFINFCPIYNLLGIDTSKSKK
jgi:hypothetical protein